MTPSPSKINLKNDRLIRALLCESVDQTPVWMMRQAGRYLPEYRELRKKVPDFMTFCQTPELACEATLQPLKRFPLDAAIVFSDILTIPKAMGLDLQFIESKGPVISDPILHENDLKRLKVPEVDHDLAYVMQAVSLSSKALDGKVPLIGFSGSPWTLATYMIEGDSSKLFQVIKKMLYQNPELLKKILQQLTDVIVPYLQAQVEAGADALMVFDTWGGVLAHREYEFFSLHYLNQIAKKLNRIKNGKCVPLIFFTKGGGLWLNKMAESGCDAIGLDWTVNILDAKKIVSEKIALQGNLDPMVLFSNPKKIQEEVKKILDDVGERKGFVFNLGHGIDQHTPIENVEAMIEAVQS
jgi:uroporphyrinogen decarboxylase